LRGQYVPVYPQIAYALEKGYIPIIDMQSHRNPFTNSVGEINAWELYFKQPCGIGLNQIEKGAKCIYSLEYFGPKSPFLSSLFDEKEKEFWKIIASKFIIFNDFVGSYINKEANNLLKGGKTLGLLFRGTDYTALKPKNHPIQPNVEQFIEQIKISLEKWGDFDLFYLATEEQRIVQRLQILVNSRSYYDNFGSDFLFKASFERENDEFLKGLEYLSSIIILSRCNSIIAGACAGTYAASFFKEDYFNNEYFFNYGLYQ
jgi:hypothetical protein